MANWLSGNGQNKFRVIIPRYLCDNYFTEYELIVQFPNNINWIVIKRYSDFLKLYEELASSDSKFRIFFPPKKIFKNTKDYFINQRRKSLEMYMNEIISLVHNYLPRSLAAFLEMDKYEIHGITTNLARVLFKYGDMLLMSKNIFEISVLSIYAINQRMVSAAPTNIYNKPPEDFGNVLEVIESTQSVKIKPYNDDFHGQDPSVGTSNIKIESLTFDISIFCGAVSLELNSVQISNMRGLYKMNPVVEILKAHHCLKSVEDILFGDLVCRSSSLKAILNFDGPWRCVTTADFSNNSIISIDRSIVTLKQVSRLNLSKNQLTDLQYLNHLTFLTVLDLSYNNLFMCQEMSFSHKLGSIKRLFLKGNKLTKLTLVDRMFSLEYLDISDNNISEFKTFPPLCRLSCLETLIFKNNPISYNSEFFVVLFDLFLDQLHSILINGLFYSDLTPPIQTQIINRRILKQSIFRESSFNSRNNTTLYDNMCESGITNVQQNLLMSIDLDTTHMSTYESILNIPDMFNILIYWFYSATKKSVTPTKLLWCTEIFSPNRCIRPAPILLISSASLNASILKCSIETSFNENVHITSIKPRQFIDINKNLKNLIIGADKSFIRFDMGYDNRSLYLVNNSTCVDSFMGHLYCIDDEIVGFGDSRLVFLNKEDRLDSLRRFIDIWRVDMITSLRRSGDNRNIDTDTESEILFNSRAMLQMQNGFQLLLTVVVTRQMLCLVDERIYDWPDLIKRPSFSDLVSISNNSPLSSSSSQFQFLRTNAYFFHQIRSCSKQPKTNIDTILANCCPIFGYSLQMAFNSISANNNEVINLFFESDNKTEDACELINKLWENQSCTLANNIPFTDPVLIKVHIPAEIPVNLKYLNPSFLEIRLNLSLFCPKLFSLSQLSPEKILSFCSTKHEISELAKIYGIVWSKFIYWQFETPGPCEDKHEISGLVCLSSNRIDIIYETEETTIHEPDCWSDPESDQPDTSNNLTNLNTISIHLDQIFKIYIGLYNQWLTLCCRDNENESENNRLVLIMRNSDLTKKFVSWLKILYSDHKENVSEKLELHDDSNIKELLFQIQKTAKCEDIDLVHYTSVEDVRLDSPTTLKSNTSDYEDICTYALVITGVNISVIRHNIVEYPVRHFGQTAVRQSPRHSQYQILIVIPLYECLQLQLPGHDKNLLVIIVQSNNRNSAVSTFKIQLSISCQKEQKHLIDKLRQQWVKCMQVDIPLRVIVC